VAEAGCFGLVSGGLGDRVSGLDLRGSNICLDRFELYYAMGASFSR
jgi:hypothetical protein